MNAYQERLNIEPTRLPGKPTAWWVKIFSVVFLVLLMIFVIFITTAIIINMGKRDTEVQTFVLTCIFYTLSALGIIDLILAVAAYAKLRKEIQHGYVVVLSNNASSKKRSTNSHHRHHRLFDLYPILWVYDYRSGKLKHQPVDNEQTRQVWEQWETKNFKNK